MLANKPLQTDSRAVVGARRALLLDAAAAEREAFYRTHRETDDT